MLDFMRLVTFQAPGKDQGGPPQAGIVSGSQVIGLGRDMLSVIADGILPPATGPAYELAAVRLLAPIPRPPKFICVGLNYRDHARESGLEVPTVPTIFSKFSNVVIGPGAPISLPPDSPASFATGPKRTRRRQRGAVVAAGAVIPSRSVAAGSLRA